MQLMIDLNNWKYVENFPIEKLVISPLNLRAGVNDERHVKTLAESINEHGYLPYRAILVNQRNGDNRIVAGSNRFRAMRYLGRASLPCYIIENLSDEEEAKYSELDNELDETHKPTHFLDKAEAFQRLLVDKGITNIWIAEQYYGYRKHENRVRQLLKIAQIPEIAKDIIRGKNSQGVFKILRIKNEKSLAIKSQEIANYFKETHFQEITKLRPVDQIKVVAQIALSQGKLKGQKLQDECEKYQFQLKLKRLILDCLYEKKLSILRDIFRDIEKGIYGDGKGDSIEFEDSALGKRIAQLNEKAKCRFDNKDSTDPDTWKEIDDKSIAVTITDPPYGIDYLTNYRIVKNDTIAQSILNDDDVKKALDAFSKTLAHLNVKMQDDSHLYVFSSWKVYPEFAKAISEYFEIKNVIVWDKQNWTAGDLEGNYAEQYEIIIFATRGNRKLQGEKRLTNLMSIPRVAGNEQIISTQKPVKLIETLLIQSASEGELVCDPFVGSGTLAIACKDRNPYFCVELNEDVYKRASRRIQECMNKR